MSYAVSHLSCERKTETPPKSLWINHSAPLSAIESYGAYATTADLINK